MEKIAALNHVYAVIEAACETLTPLGSRQELEHLRHLQNELTAHRQMMELADLACALGLAGTAPVGWEEWGGGQPYDPYQEVLIALDAVPGNGHLSPALFAYIDALPGRAQGAHDRLIASARADTEIWPDNPIKNRSEEQVGRDSMTLYLQQVEATGFATTYADDLTQARQLAEARDDFGRIRALLA